ncbi:hypothetical protein IWW38_002775 [Coemansia aciculifera]|uniref:Uncharacterized protein n=1 Tax=Coemansia aciculifera TaxID=417176 RepID=A0ACC1M4D8_9FUNG|nr:hypothetical protein IWW38_002775 [Coemansia aciculifera]
MVDSPALFQTLPMLIVRKVVEYLEGRSSNSFNADMAKYNEGKSVLAPLLTVGERWCAAALASLCNNCLVKFDYASESVRVTYPAWPEDAPNPRVRKNHLAKRVVVSAPLWEEMCDGKFCKAIERPEYEGLVFLSATTLELRLNKEVVRVPTSASRPNLASTPASVSDITEEQVARFVRSVRSLTPAASGVTIAYESIADSSGNTDDLYFTLLTELYRVDITRMQAYSITGKPTLFGMTMPTGLASIVHGSDMVCYQFGWLAYYNSSTLRSLDIRLQTEDDWYALLYRDTDRLVEFECLESLRIHIYDASYTTTWAAIADAAPFPVLSTLYVSGGYPFDDDVLFKGNGQTMKSLRLPFSALARNALGRFNVLKRKGAERLSAVRIGAYFEEDEAFVAELAVVPIEQQIYSIMEVAVVVSTTEDTPDLHIYDAIIGAPKTSNLRHLELGRLNLYIAGVIDIISALPTLTSLACDLQEPRLTAMTSPDSKSPSDLHAKHYPLSSNLRKIRVRYTTTATPSDLAKIAMLIAILCPKLVHVDIAPDLRDDFSREIAWGTYSRPFEPYADSIRRLIYKV